MFPLFKFIFNSHFQVPFPPPLLLRIHNGFEECGIWLNCKVIFGNRDKIQEREAG